MFVTPSSPGDGAATPGDTAGQGAAPPGDQVILADARGWPLPPPCPGYRTAYISGHGAGLFAETASFSCGGPGPELSPLVLV